MFGEHSKGGCRWSPIALVREAAKAIDLQARAEGGPGQEILLVHHFVGGGAGDGEKKKVPGWALKKIDGPAEPGDWGRKRGKAQGGCKQKGLGTRYTQVESPTSSIR